MIIVLSFNLDELKYELIIFKKI
jgi:hypothetical protein